MGGCGGIGGTATSERSSDGEEDLGGAEGNAAVVERNAVRRYSRNYRDDDFWGKENNEPGLRCSYSSGSTRDYEYARIVVALCRSHVVQEPEVVQ